jgi:SAM-dependent methyltransferase
VALAAGTPAEDRRVNDALAKKLGDWRNRAVLPHIRGRLLDVGCGLNTLVRRYGNGMGVDVYDWGDIDLVVEDTAKLPLDDESFDTATIIAALNHIPNRIDVLKEIHRVLRPSGILIITMIPPVISRVWHLIRWPWDDDQRERGMKPGEVYGITRRGVVELLTMCGFSLQHSERFMLGINCLTVSQKVMRV